AIAPDKARSNLVKLRVTPPGGALSCAQVANGQAGTGERLLFDQLCGKAERAADLAHPLPVKLRQRVANLPRLDAPHQLGDTVVVRLDERGFLRSAGLDGVRINRALPEQP